MAVQHGSSKKVLYKNSLCLRGKYLAKYLDQLRKPTVFGELKNEELDELIKHRNIINYVKAQRMSWFGHTNRMPKN